MYVTQQPMTYCTVYEGKFGEIDLVNQVRVAKIKNHQLLFLAYSNAW